MIFILHVWVKIVPKVVLILYQFLNNSIMWETLSNSRYLIANPHHLIFQKCWFSSSRCEIISGNKKFWLQHLTQYAYKSWFKLGIKKEPSQIKLHYFKVRLQNCLVSRKKIKMFLLVNFCKIWASIIILCSKHSFDVNAWSTPL